MKSTTLVLIFISFFSSLIAQPKAYIVKVETLNMLKSENDLLNWHSNSYYNPLKNREIDLSYISNRVDSLLRSDYFDGFPFEIENKDTIVGNDSYQSFDSEAVDNYLESSIYKETDEILGAKDLDFYSLADGYVYNETFMPFVSSEGDLENFKSIFPTADLFIGVEIELDIMQTNLSEQEPKSLRFTIRTNIQMVIAGNKKFNNISRSSWIDIPKEDMYFKDFDTYDKEIEKQYFNILCSKLISKLNEKKFKDLKRVSKWFSKKYE